MVTTVTTVADPAAGAANVHNTSLGSTKETPVSGVYDIIFLEVDNSANGSDTAYLKIYDAANADVTVGTTAPDIIFRALPGKVTRVDLRGDNLELATALTWACVTAGGTGGTTAPTSAVVVRATVISG